MCLRAIDALAPLSNNILIVCTLGFLFSSLVPGLIWEFVEFLPRRFEGKIISKVMDDKSVIAHYLNLFLIRLA